MFTLGDLGSDHTPVLSVLKFKPDLIEREKRPKWIIKEEKWEKWYEEVCKLNIIHEDIINEEMEEREI